MNGNLTIPYMPPKIIPAAVWLFEWWLWRIH